MNDYKERIRNIRKLIKCNKNNSNKLVEKTKLLDEINHLLLRFDALDMLVIAFCILSNNYQLISSFLFVEYLSIIVHAGLIVKIMENNKVIRNMNKDSINFKNEIRDIHYLNLEKKRNEIYNSENNLDRIEKEIELLKDYKTRITSVYDNNPPKEIDKEIEYLNQKIKVKK